MRLPRAVRVLAGCAALGASLAPATEADVDAAADEPKAASTAVRALSEGERLAELRRSEQAFLLGLAAQDHGDLAAAEDAYRRAIDIDAGFVEARVNLARAVLAQGRHDEAARILGRAVALRTDYAPAYTALGLLALIRGDAPRARNELERALLVDPADIEARVNLASLLIRQRALGPARQHLEQALVLEPADVDATLNLALLEDLSGHWIEAGYLYARYLDLAGGDDPDRGRVERRLRRLGGEAPGDEDAETGEAPTARRDTAAGAVQGLDAEAAQATQAARAPLREDDP